MVDPAELVYRVRRLEEDVKGLKDAKPDVLAERVQSLYARVHDLADDVESLRRAIIGAALAVCVSAVGTVIAITQVFS